ncbi:hypothetical protein MBLNU459_g6832t2 [Dothideomycetes sp. NU459]
MSLDADTAQELIRKLNTDRDLYLESVNKTTELLLQAIAASGGTTYNPLSRLAPQRPIADPFRRPTLSALEVESVHQTNSAYSGEGDSTSEDGDSLYADLPLQPEKYDIDGFIEHISTYKWTEAGRKILQGVIDNHELLERPGLFPQDLDTSDDRSHLSHGSIYDVGEDGIPYSPVIDNKRSSKSMEIWERIRAVNSDPDQSGTSVGKMICLREPSPLLFAALHYTMHKHFDVDELFGFLIDHDPVLVRPHSPFSNDHRRRRTFVFNMEYFTLIGESCVPMPWQRFDTNAGAAETHIPITRCSATIALSLEGNPVSMVKNKDRRVNRKYGQVYDPFSPWRVLVIQAYPDWESTIEDVEDDQRQRKHIVNGPEAFLTVFKQELRDAAKRLLKVYRRIEDLVQVPPDFIFRLETRDKLLFEDDEFTYSRRYFWAAQTLGIMSQDIRDMIESYRDTFNDSVWHGTDKIVWPGSEIDMSSARHLHWQEIERTNEKKIQAIQGLRDNLFSGTSVMESRRSVEMAETAILQGNNIRILTLVTIFFLPLTFVTSVYGMTNMPPNDSFYHFAWTTLAVCLPTYILILSLNLPGGLGWWTTMSAATHRRTAIFVGWFKYRPQWIRSRHEREPQTPSLQPTLPIRPPKARSRSTEVAMGLRAATGTATMFSPSVLSPVISRTMSADELKMEGVLRANAAASPTATSVRFDFDAAAAAATTAVANRSKPDLLAEEIGPTTPVEASAADSAEKNEAGVAERQGSVKGRRHGRSRSFMELFRRRKVDGEEQELPDLC